MVNFFAKLGQLKRRAEWLPIFLMRLCIGFFFILSGFFKIFDLDQHDKLKQVLMHSHLPAPDLLAYIIPIAMLLFGACIIIGFLTSFSSLILFILTLAALISEHLIRDTFHGGLLTIENFFYLPEVLYGLIFFWLFFSGPGKLSFDYLIGKKKRASHF